MGLMLPVGVAVAAFFVPWIAAAVGNARRRAELAEEARLQSLHTAEGRDTINPDEE